MSIWLQAPASIGVVVLSIEGEPGDPVLVPDRIWQADDISVDYAWFDPDVALDAVRYCARRGSIDGESVEWFTKDERADGGVLHIAWRWPGGTWKICPGFWRCDPPIVGLPLRIFTPIGDGDSPDQWANPITPDRARAGAEPPQF